MAKKLTLADVVESALLEKIEELEPTVVRLRTLRSKVDDPDKMIADLYGIVALMRQPQEPKYWSEASKKHPVEFPQFVQNRAVSGAHSSDSMDECATHEALEKLLVQARRMRKLLDVFEPPVEEAIERAELVLGIR